MSTIDVYDPAPDVRYNPRVTGYSHPIRSRMRRTETQVGLVVTSCIRDAATAALHLEPDTLRTGFERVQMVEDLYRLGLAGVGDLREAFVTLAATAIICAEETDRPRELAGVRAPRRVVAPADAPLRLPSRDRFGDQ